MQWSVALFSTNFASYVSLDVSGGADNEARVQEVVLPEGFEPLLVEGGFASLIPARRCVLRE